MAKGAGGGGRSGGGSASGVSDYSGVNTVKNTGRTPGASFTSNSDPSKRIVVSPVTDGSEKQNDYATNLKLDAMYTVDKTASNLIKRGADEKKTATWRNRLMKQIDNENNARSTIDKLKNISKDATRLTTSYGIKP